MKISVVIAQDVKQVMMTPETDHERDALKWISVNEDIEIAKKWGTYDDKPSHFSYNTEMCRGEYLRRFAQQDSLMFVITPKKKNKSKDLTTNIKSL